jgi:AraC-like DNA-binding protein
VSKIIEGHALTMAADMLRSSRTTIGAIARQVGYGTPFALSSAFKRAYGVSPNTDRADVGDDDGDRLAR